MFGGRIACQTASYECDNNAVYFQDWTFMIKMLRNFPAVFDYTMCVTNPAVLLLLVVFRPQTKRLPLTHCALLLVSP